MNDEIRTITKAETELADKVGRLMGTGVSANVETREKNETSAQTEITIFIDNESIHKSLDNIIDSFITKGFIRCERNGINVLETPINCILNQHRQGENNQTIIRMTITL